MVGEVVAMHRMTWEILSPWQDGVMSIRHSRVQRRTAHGMRKLLTKSHNDFLRVSSKDIMAGVGLSREELRKSISNLLVLGLLGGVGMDAGSRASRSWAATIP